MACAEAVSARAGVKPAARRSIDDGFDCTFHQVGVSRERHQETGRERDFQPQSSTDWAFEAGDERRLPRDRSHERTSRFPSRPGVAVAARAGRDPGGQDGQHLGLAFPSGALDCKP